MALKVPLNLALPALVSSASSTPGFRAYVSPMAFTGTGGVVFGGAVIHKTQTFSVKNPLTGKTISRTIRGNKGTARIQLVAKKLGGYTGTVKYQNNQTGRTGNISMRAAIIGEFWGKGKALGRKDEVATALQGLNSGGAAVIKAEK